MRDDAVLAVAIEWIERHCVVPDGFNQGAPFTLYDYQFEYLSNFYLTRGSAEWRPHAPMLSTAFVYSHGGLCVMAQKTGKGPMSAAHIMLEAVGPALFAGWAGPGDAYCCADNFWLS